MDTLGKRHRAQDLERLDLFDRSVNKLGRTFAMQVDALKRLRSGGVQKVVVQHVQVNEGGQAIVAGKVQGVGGGSEMENQPHVRSIPKRLAVHSDLEEIRPTLPRSGGEWLVGVPVPRRSRRSPKGA